MPGGQGHWWTSRDHVPCAWVVPPLPRTIGASRHVPAAVPCSVAIGESMREDRAAVRAWGSTRSCADGLPAHSGADVSVRGRHGPMSPSTPGHAAEHMTVTHTHDSLQPDHLCRLLDLGGRAPGRSEGDRHGRFPERGARRAPAGQLLFEERCEGSQVGRDCAALCYRRRAR